MRKGEFYHNTVTLYSKKYCYVLMILHPKGLSTFMSFLPDLKIGISSKITEIFPCHTLDECSQKEQTLKTIRNETGNFKGKKSLFPTESQC